MGHFLGTYDAHNFSRKKGKRGSAPPMRKENEDEEDEEEKEGDDVLGKRKREQDGRGPSKKNARKEDEDDEDEVDVGEEEEEENQSSSSSDDSLYVINGTWPPTTLIPTADCNTITYQFQVDEEDAFEPGADLNTRFLHIRITGKSFILHQIRLLSLSLIYTTPPLQSEGTALPLTNSSVSERVDS